MTMTDDNLVLRLPQGRPEPTVEIARSFAFKLNCGNYESADFFCSEKGQCAESEREDLSERLYVFCRSQVLKAVAEFQRDRITAQRKGAA